jgi:quinol-cytochrome oxidoreductase complex cytochrome b subunit
MSVPPGEDGKRARRSMKFFPHFLLRDLLGWAIALGVLATLAAIFPWELGEKADPFAPAFKDIRPEWYFMFMFQSLKLVPGGEILGIEYEAIPIMLFGVGALVLILVPFLDKGAARTGRSPAFTLAGILVLLYIVGMSTWGYASPIPIFITLGTAVGIFLIGLVTGNKHDGGDR